MRVVRSQSPFGTPPTTSQVIDPPEAPPTRRRIAAHRGRAEVPRRPRTARDLASIPLRRAAKRANRKRHNWLAILAIVVGTIAIAACGTGIWYVLRDDSTNTTAPHQQHTAEPSAPHASAHADPLSSRTTDPQPLTPNALFGDSPLRSHAATYPVLGTQSLDDCRKAATAELARALRQGHCTQVVRATVANADATHVATLGVVNLATAKAATTLRHDIEHGDNGGGFTAYRATGPSKSLGLKPTVLGFNTYGHYLLYVVIGRTDDRTPARDEPAVSTMVSDLVDTYLVKKLEPRRE